MDLLKISKAEYKTRIQAAQKQLQSDGLDSLLVSEEEDMYYLTGLTYKSLERLFLLVLQKNRVTFIVPQMELAHLKSVDHVTEIKAYWEYPAAEPQRWEDVLWETVKSGQRIGISGKTPFELASFLQSMDMEVLESSIIERLRWIKSPAELKCIRRAAKYCDFAIQKLNRMAYYGMSELEVFSIGRAMQQKVIKETDFDYLATNILVAAWPNRISHQPHGNPKVSDVFTDGSHISLAFLKVNGYAAELERTFFTAKPTAEQSEAFEFMMEARRRAYRVLRPGVKTSEVDAEAQQYLSEQGFMENVMHRSGHGIGLGNHEGPYLAEGDDTLLQENMVVSIEPGIYIEGTGGFRHSDTVLITKDGYEVLTHVPDSIEELTFTRSKPWQKLKGAIIKRMYGI